MATVPGTRTWSVGEDITASRLNLELRDALDFLLTDHPHCHVSDTTGTTMTNGTSTLVPFDGETYDNDTMHSTVTNNSRVNFTTAGLYEIMARVTITGGTTITTMDLNVRLNSAGSSSGGTSIRTQPWDTGGSLKMAELYFHRPFAAADYIEVFLQQSSGANRTTSATTIGTMVQARWIATA